MSGWSHEYDVVHNKTHRIALRACPVPDDGLSDLSRDPVMFSIQLIIIAQPPIQ